MTLNTGERDGAERDDASERRSAVVETEHAHADLVAAAIRPDNTDEVRTAVDGTTVRTEIERDTTGGLQATVDDYVVNLTVAEAVVESAHERHDTSNTT